MSDTQPVIVEIGYGISATHPDWYSWTTTDQGELDLINQAGAVITTIAAGKWERVHALAQAPTVITMPAPPPTPNYLLCTTQPLPASGGAD